MSCIRSIDETISFIIISGYERFDFAQRALQYGVHQYLLKPCNREQILNAVTSVKKRREKLGTLQVLRQENMLLQNRVQATMQEQFLNDIFLPDSDIEKEIDDYCAMLKAPDTDFATFYLAHGGGMMPPGLSDAIHACIARHRARLFFGLLAIRNVAILVLRISGREDTEQLKAELSQLEVDGSPITCAAKYYPSADLMLRSSCTGTSCLRQCKSISSRWKLS